jgi:hypothetical protein
LDRLFDIWRLRSSPEVALNEVSFNLDGSPSGFFFARRGQRLPLLLAAKLEIGVPSAAP